MVPAVFKKLNSYNNQIDLKINQADQQLSGSMMLIV
jgi:hypothetical protein